MVTFQHERQCKYRPYICPYIECETKLAADAVVDHVCSAHKDECRRSDGPEITASMIVIGSYFGTGRCQVLLLVRGFLPVSLLI